MAGRLWLNVLLLAGMRMVVSSARSGCSTAVAMEASATESTGGSTLLLSKAESSTPGSRMDDGTDATGPISNGRSSMSNESVDKPSSTCHGKLAGVTCLSLIVNFNRLLSYLVTRDVHRESAATGPCQESRSDLLQNIFKI